MRLREAIDRHPRSLVLRQALVQFHVAAGELDDAAKVATATMDAFPIDPESCRIAATVYRAAKRYDLAAAAAQKWRERSPVDPQPADRAMAEIRLASGDAPGALQALAPYAKEAIAHPDANAPLLVTLLRAQVRSGRAAEAKATLQPLLPKSAKWRQVWLQLAGGEVKDADAAIAWVKQVAPLTVASDPLEQTALAGAWYEISVRTHDMDANAEARKVLEPIVKQPTAPGAAVMLRAGIAERDGDFAAAEALYRRGIKLLPDQPEALNNLAYLVFLRGGDLAEAKGYAARAVELEPATANFYDTLARIQAKQGNRDAALDTFRRAVQLDPNNLEALVGLATTLCDAGKRDSAMALLPQIDTVARTRASIPAQLRREMDNLRSAVKASL